MMITRMKSLRLNKVVGLTSENKTFVPVVKDKETEFKKKITPPVSSRRSSPRVTKRYT
jgi:hypothetical protein